MNKTIIKRSFIYLKGKSTKSILFASFVFVFALSLMLVMFYHSASNEYRDILLSKYPSQITLFSKTENNVEVPQNIILEGLKIKHVIGYNNTTFNIQAEPLDFTNFVTFPDENIPSSSNVDIDADINTEFNWLIKTGQVVLVEGALPSEQQSVLVEDTLALNNNLNINDEIKIRITSDYTLKISGIYRLNSPIEINIGNGVHNSPSSKMFISYNTLQSFGDYTITNIKFFVDEYRNTNSVLHGLDSLEFDKDMFTFIQTTPTYVLEFVKAINMADYYIKIVIYIFLIIAISIFILFLVMFIRDYFYEAGVFMTLGESKRNIFNQFAAQLVICIAIPLSFSIVSAYILLPVVPALWLNEVTAPNTNGLRINNFDSERELLQMHFNTDWALGDVLLTCLAIIVIVAIYLVGVYFIMKKFTVRKFFNQKEL